MGILILGVMALGGLVVVSHKSTVTELASTCKLRRNTIAGLGLTLKKNSTRNVVNGPAVCA